MTLFFSLLIAVVFAATGETCPGYFGPLRRAASQTTFAAVQTTAAAPRNVALLLRMRLFFGDEDEEPLPQPDVKVVLLRRSLVTVLREAGVELAEQPTIAAETAAEKTAVKTVTQTIAQTAVSPAPSSKGEEQEQSIADDYLEAAARALLVPDEQEDGAVLAVVIEDAIQQNQAAGVTTDAFGTVKLHNQAAGEYYVFAATRVDDTVLVWHLPVRLKPGENFVELDQYNAEVVFEILADSQ